MDCKYASASMAVAANEVEERNTELARKLRKAAKRAAVTSAEEEHKKRV